MPRLPVRRSEEVEEAFMSNGGRRAIIAVALTALALIAGCGSPEQGEVLARIGRETITRAELMERLNDLPAHARQQYGTPDGLLELLERMVDEEVLYQAAVERGYESDPDIRRSLDIILRRMVVDAYYREEIEGATEVPEEDILAYYDEYPEMFPQVARLRFRHVMTDTRAEAAAVRQRVLAGEDIASVAREISTDDATREAGGLTKSVKAGGEIRRLGMDSTFIDRLFEWKAGEVTEPLRSEKGWHVIRIEEKTDAGTKPLEEVREHIERTLRPDKVAGRYEEITAELKQRFRVTMNEDALRPKPRSEEELFTLAEETEDPMQRMTIYAELVYNYPEGEYAAEAQFMIGFICAEELNSQERARAAFEKMLEDYPDSELAESARWMLENAGSEAPEFEEPAETAPQ